MNQNKKTQVLFCLSILIFFALFLCGFASMIPLPTGEGMSYDAVKTYAKAIETEVVTNWHSSLLIYECICLKWIMQFVFGHVVSGTQVLYVAFWIFTALMSVAYVVCFLFLVRKNKLWVWFIPFFSVTAFIGIKLIIIGLDYFFLCLLLCEAVALIWHYATKSEQKKKLLSIVILILLFHLVSYRKNALLLVPFIIGYFIYFTEYLKMSRLLWKHLAWCACVLVFSLVSIKLLDNVLPVKKTYPMIPMMEADVRISSLLRGERSPYWVLNMVRQNEAEEVENSLVAYWIGKRAAVPWSEFKDIYFHEWENHPDTMLMACLIQRAEFYMGNYGKQLMKPVVESCYPALASNPDAWKPIFSNFGKKYILRRLVIISLIPIMIIAYLAYRRKILSSESTFAVMIFGVISLVYAFSFSIVTPTPDSRYLAPSIVLGWFCILIMLGSLVIGWAQRRNDV